jgi:hypothetical protein
MPAFLVVLSGKRTRFADCSYKRTAALDVFSSLEVIQEMSGSISRKRKQKTIRQRSKEEVRWYLKFFSDIIEDHQERTMFPTSEYTALTPEQLLRLVQGELMTTN